MTSTSDGDAAASGAADDKRAIGPVATLDDTWWSLPGHNGMPQPSQL
jgi:hypothetical protein